MRQARQAGLTKLELPASCCWYPRVEGNLRTSWKEALAMACKSEEPCAGPDAAAALLHSPSASSRKDKDAASSSSVACHPRPISSQPTEIEAQTNLGRRN